MTALLLLALAGLLIPGLVVGGRWVDGRNWRRSLVALRLRVPGNVTTADVGRWVARLQVMTESPQWYLIPNQPVALEVSAVRGEITHTLLVPKRLQAQVLASLRAGLPTVRAEEIPDYLKRRPRFRAAAEGTLSHQFRPLAVERAAETSQHLLASLQPLHHGEQIIVQWIFSGISRRRPRRIVQQDSSPWWLDSDALADAEDIRAERLKFKSPLVMASVRVGVSAKQNSRAWRLFRRVWSTLGGMDAAGVRLLKCWYVSARNAGIRLTNVQVPVVRWPLNLNVEEAAGRVGLAADGLNLPGMPAGIARTLPAPPSVSRRGLLLAESNYPADARPLGLTRSDRLRHLWMMGPTGTGKSTLLQNMIYQDMQAGDGLIVIDARGDLVHSLLDRVPPERIDDIVLIDAANTNQVVSLSG